MKATERYFTPVKNSDQYQDLGIGSSAAAAKQRFINRDGSFNVVRRGLPYWLGVSPYHAMLTMSWWRFNIIIIALYVLVNLFFASLYMLVGMEHLGGTIAHTPFERFFEAFFFSAQTFTTVGYGRINPIGMTASSIAALESMVGLLAFALATGLLYGRFSRPTARILFSDNAVIAPYKAIKGFMFRIANARSNQIIEVEVQVTLSRNELDDHGKTVRKFYTLELERQKVVFFHLSWTIVHPIDEASPLYGWTKADLDASEAEFLILFKGFDDTFSQTVHARGSYKHFEVLENRKFAHIITIAQSGVPEIDLDRIHDVEEAGL